MENKEEGSGRGDLDSWAESPISRGKKTGGEKEGENGADFWGWIGWEGMADGWLDEG